MRECLAWLVQGAFISLSLGCGLLLLSSAWDYFRQHAEVLGVAGGGPAAAGLPQALPGEVRPRAPQARNNERWNDFDRAPAAADEGSEAGEGTSSEEDGFLRMQVRVRTGWGTDVMDSTDLGNVDGESLPALADSSWEDFEEAEAEDAEQPGSDDEEEQQVRRTKQLSASVLGFVHVGCLLPLSVLVGSVLTSFLVPLLVALPVQTLSQARGESVCVREGGKEGREGEARVRVCISMVIH
jgi:hypothetical protein